MSVKPSKGPFAMNARSFRAAILAAMAAFLAPIQAGAADEKNPSAQPAPQAPSFRIEFADYQLNDPSTYPKDWKFKGKWGTPPPSFYVVQDPESGRKVLKIEAKKASGSILYNLTGKVDLKKTPIVRWRWKAAILPSGADGRAGGKDDQAIGLYFGCGSLTRKSVAYRWETLTPLEEEGSSTYGAGIVSARWHCLRNQNDPLGKWIVEERNLAEDFKKDFGELPQDIALSVASNSQYTSSEAEAYLDYVEFLPPPQGKPSN